jgi:DNA-binding LacI/PurR family transcriptional regulator
MVTIKDISAKCGLSIATISKSLNNYSDISEDTKAFVRKTAQEMGYYPNILARALKTNRTYNLGVLFVDDNESGLKHNYFAAVLDSFKVEAERKGYDITFINHNIGNRSMTYLEHCKYRNIDGVCLACVDFLAPEVVELVNGNIPVVTIDHIFNNVTCIMSENRQGINDILKFVYEMGHRKISYIHGPKSAVTDIRLTSFYKTMSDYDIALRPEYLIEAPYHDPASTFVAVQKLLDLKDAPTCILVPDDYSALGAMQAIQQRGLSVGKDVSIVGYDGLELTQMITPKLTTLQQDTVKLGSEAARQLVALIEDPLTTFNEKIVVPGKLIKGETVGIV